MGVAQSVERQVVALVVAGSSPVSHPKLSQQPTVIRSETADGPEGTPLEQTADVSGIEHLFFANLLFRQEKMGGVEES